jgi:hypothetical protein
MSWSSCDRILRFITHGNKAQLSRPTTSRISIGLRFPLKGLINWRPFLPYIIAVERTNIEVYKNAALTRGCFGFVFERVATLYILIPKVPIWIYFTEKVELFYGQLAYFVSICSILWPFGTFFPVLVCYTKKNWKPWCIKQPSFTGTRAACVLNEGVWGFALQPNARVQEKLKRWHRTKTWICLSPSQPVW